MCAGEFDLCQSRGRPNPRRLPQRVCARILQLARTRYVGFNDHHLHAKLTEQEDFSLSRTLRRLLRASGIGSKESWCSWTALRTTGLKVAVLNSPLWVCG